MLKAEKYRKRDIAYMFHNLLLVMSLSGSAVLAVYLLVSLVAHKYVFLKWQYRILKIAVVFYLFPFSKCKYLVTGMLHRCFPCFQEQNGFLPGRISTEYAVIVDHGVIHLSTKLKFMWIIISLAVIISFIFVIKQGFLYWKMKKTYFTGDGGKGTESLEWAQLLAESKRELKMKRNVKFVCSVYCRAPMTSGILNPLIVFPIWNKKTADRELYGYMAKHELVHIMHRDLLVKFLGVLVIAVHWFNPFSYVLFRELTNISEMYCDEAVMDGKDEAARRKYGELILGLAQDKNYLEKGRFLAGLADSRNKKVYRRRILELKVIRKHGLMLSLLLAGLAGAAGGITAFAYDEPDKIVNNIEYTMNDNTIIAMEKMESQGEEKLISDYFCIDENGNIYDLISGDSDSRKICIHSYVSGTFYIHELNDKGGCTMITCEGYICSNCKNVILEKELHRDTYNPCRH